MRVIHIRWILFVIVAIVCPSLVFGLFERMNRQVTLGPNQVYRFQALPYAKSSSTRIAFVGTPGHYLSLVCNIVYSQRNNRCSDDYFYVAYDLDPYIRNSEYYCGHRQVRKTSKQTTGAPVLAVGKLFQMNRCDVLCQCVDDV